MFLLWETVLSDLAASSCCKYFKPPQTQSFSRNTTAGKKNGARVTDSTEEKKVPTLRSNYCNCYWGKTSLESILLAQSDMKNSWGILRVLRSALHINQASIKKNKHWDSHSEVWSPLAKTRDHRVTILALSSWLQGSTNQTLHSQ